MHLYKSVNRQIVNNLFIKYSYHVHNQGLRYSHDNKHGDCRGSYPILGGPTRSVEGYPIPKNQTKSNSTIQATQICTVCTNLKKLEKTT